MTQELLSTQYTPGPGLDLRYTATYANPQDRVHSTDTTSITQTGGVNYGRTLEPWSTHETRTMFSIGTYWP